MRFCFCFSLHLNSFWPTRWLCIPQFHAIVRFPIVKFIYSIGSAFMCIKQHLQSDRMYWVIFGVCVEHRTKTNTKWTLNNCSSSIISSIIVSDDRWYYSLPVQTFADATNVHKNSHAYSYSYTNDNGNGNSIMWQIDISRLRLILVCSSIIVQCSLMCFIFIHTKHTNRCLAKDLTIKWFQPLSLSLSIPKPKKRAKEKNITTKNIQATHGTPQVNQKKALNRLYSTHPTQIVN